MKKYRFIWESELNPLVRAVLAEVLDGADGAAIDREVIRVCGLVGRWCKLYRIELDRVLMGFVIVDYERMEIMQLSLRFPAAALLKEVEEQVVQRLLTRALAPL